MHSNYIEYKPVKKEIKLAEEADKKQRRLEEIVVLFIAVEEGDTEDLATQTIEEIQEFLGKLKVKKILIYPYAHLSQRLSKPAVALRVIKAIEKEAIEKGLETYRAPFGWNKQFTISIKGHPLAEQSRVISPGKPEEKEKISEALKAEEKMKTEWFIMQPNGNVTSVDEFDFSKHKNLEKFAQYEISKKRASSEIPPHIELMKRLELADYEPGSDPGNLRWYPKGRLVKSLIELLVADVMAEYGAMEVETPIMYDYNHPTLSSYLDRFPARQYVVKSEDKDLFLRFAACFGQFLMLHDAQISYRQLPLRIYELTRYSFRREKSGEIAGLRRQRAFTMPDCHALCIDLKQAKEEFLVRFKLCQKILKNFDLGNDNYELGIRFTKDFYKENKDFIASLVDLFGRPALVELLEGKILYWILKWEFNFIDNQDKASALSTDQLDVENALRYEITYIDERGERKNPLILHCSPSGGVERSIYAMLEKAHQEKLCGNVPSLPLWLSPTQVRVIPVSDKYTRDAEEIVEKITEHKIRVDLDDRPLTMQKKIREAEREWINYIIAVGQKELETNLLSVRDRCLGNIKKMKLNKLTATILNEIEGKPFKPLPLPRRLSQRPQFYG